jgi:Carboxypeptidase regulatory-like domain
MFSHLPVSINRILAYLTIFLSVASLIPISGTGAQSPTAGATTGRVFEGNLLPLPGVRVTVINEQNGNPHTTITDSSGTYQVQFLTPGTYRITASKQGFSDSTVRVVVPLGSIQVIKPPDITLKPSTVSTVSVIPDPQGPEAGSRVDTIDATRSANFTLVQIESLPLGGSTAMRTFDDLAFLAPGVAPPPQAIGTSVGPGVGPGVGTSGQFSVNGMRSRSNNFTIDGSDNNDEDIGVRRQGFASIVPQSVESVQELRIITLLPEPQFGRSASAQVDAVSRSGGTNFHLMLYGFFTNSALKARDVFDLTGGPLNFPITRSNGTPVLVEGVPEAPSNPVEGENKYTRGQYGIVIGGPVVKDKLFFFGSVERQKLDANRESHFAVPTVAERGLSLAGGELTGDQGIIRGGFFGGPTSLIGDAFFSLFPFPNNPRGPYGANTYTEVLPANAKGWVFSGKLDRPNIQAFGRQHSLTGRYNFTDDNAVIPVTGGALFSSLRALVRTQNLSFFFDSQISSRLANQFRTSYGRTSLRFIDVPNANLLPSKILPKQPFLLNRPLLRNVTRPGLKQAEYITLPEGGGPDDCKNPSTTEGCIGLLGQLVVSGYSPVGVDVLNFSQQRANNVIQFADTLIYNWGIHKLTAGFDLRRIQLNSQLDRNFRPLAVFSGSSNPAFRSRSGIPLPSELQGRDFVSVGAPIGFTQTLALIPDSTIGLRSWQNGIFLSDQIHVRPNLTLTLGARYDLSTVPQEATNRIEKTFTDQQVGLFIANEKRMTGRSGLEQFLAGREKIYEGDHNNIAPYFALAWDPFGTGKTSIRAGFGIYYDQIPGAVVSQSRTVFPSFLTLNLAGIPSGSGTNPRNLGLDFLNPFQRAQSGTLNTFKPDEGSAAQVIAGLNQFLKGDFARPDFVLPIADLVTPYSEHWGLTIEREINPNTTLSAAYVGTRGVHLLRFATPNLGPNIVPDVQKAPAKIAEPIIQGESVNLNRPFPGLGSFTAIVSDANSIYHSLQVQLNQRLSHGLIITTAYTWSHAIDEVSELFDLAGARALPQNSLDRAAERSDANFDVRHRLVYSIVWSLPGFKNRRFLGGWQVASIGTFQTGQPYSVYSFYDVNQDGNLSDRVNPDGSLPGRAGRNLFRAPGLATVDLALNKTFKFSERQGLEFRTEVFNFFNRSNFGIPVNELRFGGLGDQPLREQIFGDTRVPARTVQVALKYRF